MAQRQYKISSRWWKAITRTAWIQGYRVNEIKDFKLLGILSRNDSESIEKIDKKYKPIDGNSEGSHLAVYGKSDRAGKETFDEDEQN